MRRTKYLVVSSFRVSFAKTGAELLADRDCRKTVGNVGGDLIITITWRHRHAGLRTLARTFAVLDVHRDGDASAGG
jgi:hypothetical protein